MTDRLDTLDMFGAAASLGTQVAAARDIANAVEGLPSADGVNSVVVLGMGGSGIGGDLLAAATGSTLPVPVVVPKGYAAPEFVGPDTLVFAVSFSGNTEETVEAATDAANRGARMVVIAAGGEMARLAEDWGAVHVPIVEGIPMPRAGIGAVSIPPMVILERMGLIADTTAEIDSAVRQLTRRADELTAPNSVAATLARRIGRTMPIVYGGGSLGEVAAHRWKAQFNENVKIPAFANRVPELTHNEICGWGQNGDVTRQVFTLLNLRHDHEHSQTARRFDMVAGIMGEVMAGVHEVRASGETLLAQLFDLILMGDFVSLELAAQTEVDPGPVPILDYLKSSLRR